MHKLVEVFSMPMIFALFSFLNGKNAVNRWHTQVSTRWPYDDERSDDHHHTFSDVPTP